CSSDFENINIFSCQAFIIYFNNLISDENACFVTRPSFKYISHIYSIPNLVKLDADTLKISRKIFIGFFEFNRGEVNGMRIKLIHHEVDSVLSQGVYIYRIYISGTDNVKNFL